MNRFFHTATLGTCILICFISLNSCKWICKNCCEERIPQKEWYSSANVLLPSIVDDNVIRAKIKAAALISGGILNDDDIKIRRCPCDSLINLALPPGWIIEGHDPGGIAVRTPGNGQSTEVDLPGRGSLLVGLNYPISTFDSSMVKRIEKESLEGLLEPISNSTKEIKIAVFDSGLTGGYLASNYVLKTSQCNTDQILDPAITSASGWNFTSEGSGSTDVNDLTPNRHGSRVANLVARQFNGSNILPKIVPMKVLTGSNQGDLYGLMCAMKTAQKNKVKIFNMSLGYYGQPDTLLQKYVSDAQNAGIWMIVAAGNHLVDSTNLKRDLTDMPYKFYPAYFATKFDKVVPVTTVQKSPSGSVIASYRQNYAKDYVIGAMDSHAGIQDFYFYLDSNTNIWGSSYATPVVAGWLGKQLGTNPNGLTNRDALANRIPDAGMSGDQVKQNKYVISRP